MGRSGLYAVQAISCNWGTPTPAQWDEFHYLGDVNRDGYINDVDLDLYGAAAGSTPGSPNWNPDADLNGDGVVDYLDLNIIAGHYGLDICTYFGRRAIKLQIMLMTAVVADVPFTIGGYLTAVDTGEPLAGKLITIVKDGFAFGSPLTTDSNGYFEFSDVLSIGKTAAYEAGFGGDTEFQGC